VLPVQVFTHREQPRDVARWAQPTWRSIGDDLQEPVLGHTELDVGQVATKPLDFTRGSTADRDQADADRMQARESIQERRPQLARARERAVDITGDQLDRSESLARRGGERSERRTSERRTG
jgi:hypothetical protein